MREKRWQGCASANESINLDDPEDRQPPHGQQPNNRSEFGTV